MHEYDVIISLWPKVPKFAKRMPSKSYRERFARHNCLTCPAKDIKTA